MSHEDFEKELQALRENLPTVVEESSGSKSVSYIQYSLDLGRRIADEVAQGKSLAAIARKSEMPAYSTLLRWSKEHPELSKMLRAVRECRARHFEDAAIEAAEEAQGKDADRLKVETYKWAAEVNDPAVYGKKVAHSGEVSGKTIIQVVTGFGPPPEALDFPKLRADGTIEKTVECEVADAKESGESNNETDASGIPRTDSSSSGLTDASSSGSSSDESRV